MIITCPGPFHRGFNRGNQTFVWNFDTPCKKSMILIVEADESDFKNVYDLITEIKFIDDKSQVVEEFDGTSLEMLSTLHKIACMRYSSPDHNITEWLFPLHRPSKKISEVSVRFNRPWRRISLDRVHLELECDDDEEQDDYEMTKRSICINRCGKYHATLGCKSSFEYALPLPSASLFDVVFVIRHPFVGYTNMLNEDLIKDVIINNDHKVRSVYMTQYYPLKYYARKDTKKKKKSRDFYVIPLYKILREDIHSIVIRFQDRKYHERFQFFLDVLFRSYE